MIRLVGYLFEHAVFSDDPDLETFREDAAFMVVSEFAQPQPIPPGTAATSKLRRIHEASARVLRSGSETTGGK